MAKRGNYRIVGLARTKLGALRPRVVIAEFVMGEELEYVKELARDLSKQRSVTVVEISEITSRKTRKSGTRWIFYAEGREISDTTFIRKLNGPKK